jgi:hypothetical protein
MTNPTLQERRIANAVEYFRRVDSADPSVLDLFTDGATMYFPKLGIARGKAQIGLFAQGFGAEIVEIAHDIDNFSFYPSGEFVIVEGRERGKTRSAGAWPDGVYSQGLFCNVFEFEGELIKRVHIYADPDFNSADTARVAWAQGVHKAIASKE